MRTGILQVGRCQAETISQWGVRMDTVCGELQRAALQHTGDLAWANEKREGGGDIICLFARVSFKVCMMAVLRQWLKRNEM
jgi:hypothetical protein